MRADPFSFSRLYLSVFILSFGSILIRMSHLHERMFVDCHLANLGLLSAKKHNKWPPGPPRLPLLGNVHQLNGLLHVTLAEMAIKYGPVMTVWMGRSPTIVVSGQDAAWDALVTQGSNFASRPAPYSWQFVSAGYKTTNTSQYGPNWTKLKKLLQNSVLSPSQIATQMSRYHHKDTAVLLDKLGKEMDATHVTPLPCLKLMAVSLVARFCFGPDFPDDMLCRRIEELVAELINLSGHTHLWDIFPSTRYIPPSTGLIKRTKALRMGVMDLFLPLISSRRHRGVKFHSTNNGSMLDSLLSIQQEELESGSATATASIFSDETIAFNLFELFVLAVDSTSNALEWALAFLVTHPEIQQKAYDELKQAVPEERYICAADLDKLPYLKAIVKETLRKKGIAPLAVPHKTVEECELMGYRIPAGTQVMFNLYAMSHDETIWTDPAAFNPQRFLGQAKADAKFAYLPFGAGRRSCAGMDLANLHVPITLANLLKKFEWQPESSGKLPDMTDEMLFVLRMKHPLQARIRLRL
eukprot:Gb_07522 [translate_table: standard]